MSQPLDHLTYNLRGNVATITLNRPARMNAISPPMLNSLVRALRTANRDSAVRAVVLTGAGRAFCAGLDLKDQEREPGLDQSGGPGHFDLRDAPAMVLHQFDKPVIAAVNGPAMGYGMDLALGCDIRVFAREGTLGPVFTRLGVLPDGGDTWLLPRLIGHAKAAEIIFTGKVLDADRCLELGLANAVHPRTELDEQVGQLAGEIAANAPLAVQAAKRLLRLSANETFEAHLDHLAAKLVPLFASDDFREGLSALREKRAPEFRGR